jgi:polar amino acid transport system substrate-binding protein
MRKVLLLVALLVTFGLAAAACGGDDDDDEGDAGGTTTAAASCAKVDLELVKPGRLTIGTDNPAFPPWFEGPKANEPWDPTKRPTRKGYEAEVAYAIAEELGFAPDEVDWTVVPFAQSFRPGPKRFDFDINQVSVKPVREKAVDFSDSYYDVNQAVVAVSGTPIANAKSVADLKQYKLGAQVGTTSFDYIEEHIKPDEEPSVYDTNNDAISALKAKQIDGIVVDFPTSLYMAAVQVDNGTVVGRLPTRGEQEHFGLVFEEGNSLRECVNEAIQSLKDDGTLDRLEQKWIVDRANAPVLEE